MTHRTTLLAAGVLLLAGCFETAVADDASKVADPGVDVPEDIPADLPASPDDMMCRECTGDEECFAGAKCLPVGATKHCVLDCIDDGDCPPSYICYAAASAGKTCLPVSYNCVPCASGTPCPSGKVCDFVSGTCKDGAPACNRCTYDFDCAADAPRCYKESGSPTGVCVPECPDGGSCADAQTFTCTTTDRGVHLCLPRSRCTCTGGCPGTAPFPTEDGCGCQECLTDSHCRSPEVCNVNVSPHVCEVPAGWCGQKRCDDGRCLECCIDADCLGVPASVGTCTNGVCDTECTALGGCLLPNPFCQIVQSVPTCVGCLRDSDCSGQYSGCACSGAPAFACQWPDGMACATPWVDAGCFSDFDCAVLDPTCTCAGDPTYACLFPDGAPCQGPACGAICSIDADCPSGGGGQALKCSGSGWGFCYDPSGSCNGATACCGQGQSCFDVASAAADAMGSTPGWTPGQPAPIDAMCTCDFDHPCLGGVVCTRLDLLCTVPELADRLCPGGVLPALLQRGVCGDLQPLIALLAEIAGAR